MGRRLIRLADLVLGDDAQAGRIDRPALARFLALSCVLAIVLFARRPDAILRAQFWAEDGSVFFHDQLTRGLWGSLFTLYGGFPFVAQRLIGSLASVVPTALAPLAYNVAAIAFTALAMATFVLPGYRHLVRRDGVRAAACLATLCIPAGQDLLATPTTLGYFFSVWLLYLSVLPAPRGGVAVAVWCLGGALAVLSAPLAPVIAPLWVLRAARGIGRRNGRDLAFAATMMSLQILVLALAGIFGAAGLQGSVTGMAPPAGYPWSLLSTLAWAAATCLDAALFSMAAETTARLAVIVPALLVGAAIALALRDLSTGGRVTVCLALYLFVASLALVLAGRPYIVTVFQRETATTTLWPAVGLLGLRHRALANIALVLLTAGIFDGAQHRLTRIAATAGAIALLTSWAPELRVPPFPDIRWPIWAARLDEKLASGSTEPLVIPSYPPHFEIRFDSPPSAAKPTPAATAAPSPAP